MGVKFSNSNNTYLRQHDNPNQFSWAGLVEEEQCESMEIFEHALMTKVQTAKY